MKSILIPLMVVLTISTGTWGCSNNQEEHPLPAKTAEEMAQELIPSEYLGSPTTMEFETSVFDFGDIDPEEKVSTSFKFRNSGDNPLVIVKGFGSCGCTVPEFPKEPIMPGELGEVTVTFDPTGKTGMQAKKVYVIGNTDPPQTTLLVSANIVEN